MPSLQTDKCFQNIKAKFFILKNNNERDQIIKVPEKNKFVPSYCVLHIPFRQVLKLV